MKKIFSFLFACAAVLGLVACSGDLHDDVIIDPNAMSGNWFYYELDTSTATDDTISLIFNNAGGGKQTNDIKGVAKTGTVAYVWVSSTKDYSISTRTDCPAKGIGNTTDKLGVYVFTDSDVVSLWAWDSVVNLTGGTWPGVTMKTDAAIQKNNVDVTLNIVVTGLSEDEVVYITGTLWAWGPGWPFTSWNTGTDPAAQTAATIAATDQWATASATGVATFAAKTVEVEKGSNYSMEFKPVVCEGNATDGYTAGKGSDFANAAYTITPSATATYTVTIDMSGSAYAVTVK